MKHHNWAFVAWDLDRDKGWINDNATLVHVDQHLDAAIDGAVILDYKFNILSAGEMFSNKGTKVRGKYRGARTIAAISSSRFGLSIKVSEDGEILIFENEEDLVRI